MPCTHMQIARTAAAKNAEAAVTPVAARQAAAAVAAALPEQFQDVTVISVHADCSNDARSIANVLQIATTPWTMSQMMNRPLTV